MDQESTEKATTAAAAGGEVVALEKAYRDALALFKADKTNKDLRRARTAAKKAWDEAVVKDCLANGDEGAKQLQCRDCSQMFLWTTEEQDYYKAAERNWNHKPERCRACAELQKIRRKSHHQQLVCEVVPENNDSETIRKGGKAGRNMCYAFQRGECRYGDQCKFNHDPEFGGKKKEDDDVDGNENSKKESDCDDEISKKRKEVPKMIAICKWGKDCNMKRCRYRHDVVDGDGDGDGDASPQSPPTTKSNKEKDETDKKTGSTQPTTTTTTTPSNSSNKKPKMVMGICKWGKNCKLKRCRFLHPDESSSSSLPLSLETNEKTDTTARCVVAENASVSETAAIISLASNSVIGGTKDKTKKTTKTSKTKSSDKLVHKAMTKALKKAPQNKLRVKELRKLVRKKMEQVMGKDEIKTIVREAIAKNNDSMTLLEDGSVVKLLV